MIKVEFITTGSTVDVRFESKDERKEDIDYLDSLYRVLVGGTPRTAKYDGHKSFVLTFQPPKEDSTEAN